MPLSRVFAVLVCFALFSALPLVTVSATETKTRSEQIDDAVDALSESDLSVLQAVIGKGGGSITTVEGSPLDRFLSLFRGPIVWKQQPPATLPESTRVYEIDERGYRILEGFLISRTAREKGAGEPRGPWCLGPGCPAEETGCGELFSNNPITFKRNEGDLIGLLYYGVGYFSGLGIPLASNNDKAWVKDLAVHCAENPKLGIVYALKDIASNGDADLSVGDPGIHGTLCEAVFTQDGGVVQEAAETFPFFVKYAIGYYVARVQETGADAQLLSSRTDIFPALAAHCRQNPTTAFGDALAQTIPKPLD